MALFKKKSKLSNYNSLNPDELKECSINLTISIESKEKKIKDLNREIDDLFEEAAKSLEKRDKIKIARRIKALQLEKHSLENSIIGQEKYLSGINALLVHLNNKKDEKLYFDKIGIDPDELKDILIREKVETQEKIKNTDTITDLITNSYETEFTEEDDLEEILSIIDSIATPEPDNQSQELKIEKFEKY